MKAQTSHLIACAEVGEDMMIVGNGGLAARIVPVNSPVVETIALLRDERTRWPTVAAADGRA